MSSLLSAAAPRPRPDPSAPTTHLETLATMLIVVLTVGVLYFAREILVPIAIAVLFSFVLSPLVKVIRRTGLHKSVAVGITVTAMFLITVGLGGILAKQVSDLAAEAPKYQAAAVQKVDRARTFTANSAILHKLRTVIADVDQIGRPATEAPQPGSAAKPSVAPEGRTEPRATAPEAAAPVRVRVVPPTPDVLTVVRATAGTATTSVATTAFVALFIVFILMQREDLRNRFIRLIGSGDLQRTTLAMNDAANRLSRYFLAQLLLNTGFGIVIGAALALIGVPDAALWGIVAIFLRFVPYIGSLGAALFPMLMAAVASVGWGMVVETALLFAVVELVTGQVIEPLVYGHNTGISPIAVVLAATFWTWLWGPIGLVLSTPLTVCLVVMGRHIEQLAFLDIIFGDAPALTPVETFYQRMLSGDASEIVDHADQFLREHSLLAYCDEVAMPALLLAQGDVGRGVLEEKRQVRIRDTMRDLVEDLEDRDDDLVDALAAKTLKLPVPAALDKDGMEPPADADASPPRIVVDPTWKRDKSVVCVAGRTPLDEAAAHLLADLLAEHAIATHVEPAESVAEGRLLPLRAADPRLVILSFLDTDSKVTRARFAVRRLRRQLPGVPVVVAFWMAAEDRADAKDLRAEVRGDGCVSSLPDAIRCCLERAAPGREEPGTAGRADGLDAA